MRDFERNIPSPPPRPIPVVETTAPAVVAAPPTVVHTTQVLPRRRRWPGLLVAGVVGAIAAAWVVSGQYDDRTVGERLDASIAATEQTVTAAAEQGKAATQQVAAQAADTLGDAGITTAVKTALAADPALSALKIDVDTRDGVVRLTGPAPDEKARERAGVLAAAPDGVRSVDNQLTIDAGKG